MNYPILCSVGNTVTYTKDGKNYIKDAEPTLFFSKVIVLDNETN